jgi:hypothetical protein
VPLNKHRGLFCPFCPGFCPGAATLFLIAARFAATADARTAPALIMLRRVSFFELDVLGENMTGPLMRTVRGIVDPP